MVRVVIAGSVSIPTSGVGEIHSLDRRGPLDLLRSYLIGVVHVNYRDTLLFFILSWWSDSVMKYSYQDVKQVSY